MLRMWFDLSWQHHYSVYCLTDPEGKRYFGISRYSAAKRWKNGKGYGGNRRLKSAIVRYSFAGFRKEIIREGLTREAAEHLEAKLIERYHTTDPEKGYNVRKCTVSEQYDVYVFTFPDGKHYVGLTGRNVRKRWGYGNGYRNNRRLYQAIQDVGFSRIKKEHFSYPLSRGSAERIETALIAYFDSSNPEKGYNRGRGALRESGWHQPEETRERVRQSVRGNPKTDETRHRMRKAHEQKAVHNRTTGEVYPGVREAAELTGVSASSISRACCGKQKTAGGFEWEYINGNQERET